ncbi:MAG: methionyl-tRNA formyltransferase, partial [Candidatus Neomarinimicrobiota bacterium]|nr:methionyl-tRNA formyltransferase [Candidatus Neomarinimicrobiota bacterium]
RGSDLMRVVFMGNPQFALPTLTALLSSQHDVVGVVSNPPKPMGRGRKLKSTDIGKFAKENDLNLLQSSTLKSDELYNQLSVLNPDVFVVVAFQILPKSLIDLPKFGALNLHASLLPKYRGAGPIQWSLMNGDKTSGITVFQIMPSVDTGDILLQEKTDIFPKDNMLTLGMRLSTIGANLVVKALDGIQAGSLKPFIQNNNHATHAPKITKEMTIINWSWAADKIHNWVRGLSPHPGMSTTWKGKRMRIFNTRVVDEDVILGDGIVSKADSEEIFVDTGKHLLAFSEIQIEGKKRMNVSDFMKGNNIQIGDKLGG